MEVLIGWTNLDDRTFDIQQSTSQCRRRVGLHGGICQNTTWKYSVAAPRTLPPPPAMIPLIGGGFLASVLLNLKVRDPMFSSHVHEKGGRKPLHELVFRLCLVTFTPHSY